MASAFQQNAFQDDAFQITAAVCQPAFQPNAFQTNAFQMCGGPVPPTPTKQGGGGGHDGARRDHHRRDVIRRALERAIRESLEPTPITAERNAPVKLWTRPQRARVFPNYWKEQQILALMDAALGDFALAAAAAALVAEQRLAYELAVREAEDAAVVELVAQMMLHDAL